MTLHVIKTDILLWALEGFAKPPVESPYAKALPMGLSARIATIALRPSARRGEVAQLAEAWGYTPNVLSTHISYARKGRVPPYRQPQAWAQAAS